LPSGDQSGWSSTKPFGGCVIRRSPDPAGLIVKIALTWWSASK
jgi:hypothetical protein